MLIRFCCLVLMAALIIAPGAALAGALPIDTGGARLTGVVRSFEEMRRSKVVRQRWDLSCGAAALSTVLTYHYNDSTPESAIIVAILSRTNPELVRKRGGFSLLDLKKYAEARGYDGMGYAELSLNDLAGLGVPAIVPVKMRDYDHFVVFRGLSEDRVLLADPVFGNVTMQKDRFARIWKGGIGFVVLKKDSKIQKGGLTPSPDEFLIPDGASVARAALSLRAASPTRLGPP